MLRAVEPSCAATRLVSVAELETWGSRAASSFIKPVPELSMSFPFTSLFTDSDYYKET